MNSTSQQSLANESKTPKQYCMSCKHRKKSIAEHPCSVYNALNKKLEECKWESEW